MGHTVEIPILNMESGVLAFSAHGRVWMPDEESDKWHHGYGGGLCLAKTVIVSCLWKCIGKYPRELPNKAGYSTIVLYLSFAILVSDSMQEWCFSLL